MDIVSQLLGWAVVLLAATAFAFLAFGWACEKWKQANDRFYHTVRESAIREIARHLIDLSFWFSQDKSSFLALKIAGDYLLKNGYFEDHKIRETWRAAVKGEDTSLMD